MLIEYIKPDFEFKNENGTLIQLVHEGWKQVNVIFSNATGVRGGHYHKYNNTFQRPAQCGCVQTFACYGDDVK